MKIAVHASLSAVGWFRALGPCGYLRDAFGHEVLYLDKSKGSPEELAEQARAADVIHYVAPLGPYEKAAPAVLERRGALVVDLDDDVFAWTSDPASRLQAGIELKRTVDEGACRDLETWLRAAELVTTTTEHLAQVVREHGARDVAVCPNAIEPAMQRERPNGTGYVRTAPSVLEKALPKRVGRGFPVGHELGSRTIGWSGSIAHAPDLPPVLKAVRELATLDPSIVVRTLGPVNWTKTDEWSAPPEWRVRYEPMLAATRDGKASWTIPFPQYFDALEAIDPNVAVLPLRSSPFALGKSDVTLLAWSVQGVPAICSRVGAYAEAEKRGFPATFVSHEDTDSWKSALRATLYSPAEAREQGERARQWVLERHSFPNAAKPWEEAFARAIANRHLAPASG